ncbi:hypothetical protein DEO72_LG6g1604 [Vigna unguiculata]|uniref:Secreted protein n=1 Tax=Vigna unguiculata TaxID=3917 RepID=A0A4D6MAQ7_VIGUN|nr:hypothetical protein DEO72_LG6g1603 [Vigna unguiculata]QCD96894.1 hypothetical protein DEO72_LG6g1604 [Vigna unguiculata]
MVVLRSSCTALCFLAAANDVVDVPVEEKRDAVSGMLSSAFVFRGGQRRRRWRRSGYGVEKRVEKKSHSLTEHVRCLGHSV